MGTGNWKESREVGAFLRELFGACWNPGLLAGLAGEECLVAGQGCLESGPRPADGAADGAPALDELLVRHPVAAALLGRLAPGTGFARFLLSLARGREPEALETLLGLGAQCVAALDTQGMRDLSLFLVARLDRLPLPTAGAVRPFLSLCRGLGLFVVCSGVFVPGLVAFFLRARARVGAVGSRGEGALCDLLLGFLDVCNVPEHNSPELHAAMARGKSLVEEHKDPGLFEAAVPYLGIHAFLEGDYEQAMGFFARASRAMRVAGLGYFEMFYARHWSFAAANRGDFDLAVRLLRSRLRQAGVVGGTSLARNVRSQLASLYLRMGKDELALEQLGIALTGITEKTDIASAVTTQRQLACYHARCGNLDAAYTVLRPVLERAAAMGYTRPVYLNGVFLELLASFREKGFPPLPCYDFADELERCLEGPNRLLRGVALRVQGRMSRTRGRTEEAERSLRGSIDTLEAIHDVLDADRSRLELACLLQEGHEARARLLVREAWRSRDLLKSAWPAQLETLSPAGSGAAEDDGNARSLLDAFRESFSPRRPGVPFAAFARILLSEAGRLLGASCGWLHHRSRPSAPLRLVESMGAADREGFSAPASLEEIAELVAEGDPVILEHVGTGGDRGMLVGMPLDCRPWGLYVLCLAGPFPERMRDILDETLLGDIGRVLSWSCLLALETEQGEPGRGLPPAEGREMICSSPLMQRLLADVDNVAATDASVLLQGESGVGKEMVAQRIHEGSGRRGRLVTINMASLQDELFESEFFGHEKGAFTGAMESKLGLVELAENGTLFLDELTEASPRVQAKLLRVLQERSFLRVGGRKPIRINFRLVAATNRDMAEAVRRGTFRADLYYRVAVVCLRVPPLRERRQDILPLARYFLHHFARRHGRACVPDFSSENSRLLEAWPWPGNVRELANVVEQSVILGGGRRLDFHGSLCGEEAGNGMGQGGQGRGEWDSRSAGEETSLALQEVEKRHILAVLERTNWRIDGKHGAAGILKISRSALYARMHKYGLLRDDGDVSSSRGVQARWE